MADLVLLNANPLEQIENVGDIDRVFRRGLPVFTAPDRPVPLPSAYAASEPGVRTFTDATGTTVADGVTIHYDTTRFDAEGVRVLRYADAAGEILRGPAASPPVTSRRPPRPGHPLRRPHRAARPGRRARPDAPRCPGGRR
ncbi:hypothetical protein UA75_19295 [Actinoalloteichus sp. GBA129-24]|nr:hypothetical protein UA75_19295 [Actinoalloteichus sp. GBA129-24]